MCAEYATVAQAALGLARVCRHKTHGVRLDSEAASGAEMAPPRVPIRAGRTRPLGVALGPEGPHAFTTLNIAQSLRG